MATWQERVAEYGQTKHLWETLSGEAGSMCAPFWWSLKRDGDAFAHILHNGSICYLNTGTTELGITANHVLVQYLADRATHGNAVECQFGGSTVLPEERILGQNDDHDLATIRLPNVFVNASNLSRRNQHAPPVWPTTRVRTGDVVLYGGYPGTLREDHTKTADFPFQWIAGGVGDVTKTLFVVEPDLERVRWLNPEPGKRFNFDLRGMSGGPVFRVVHEPVIFLELVGIIYEFVLHDADNPAAGGPAVLCKHADVVLPNGSLTPTLRMTNIKRM